MSEYLTKEEVRAWRSSVEKITLEEYAARLGKKIEEKKETNDLVDIIYNGGNVVQEYDQNEAEKGIKIYQKPEPIKLERVEKPQEPETVEKIVIAPRPVLQRQPEQKVQESQPQVQKEEQPVKKIVEEKPVKQQEEPKPVAVKKAESANLNDNLGLTFNKKLTDREKRVFEYLTKNKNKVVFAKELAELLEMKRDYIYKYIKNLRAKIVEDVLENSEGGGFILKM